MVDADVHDSWATDRTGNAFWHAEGWQLTSHRDVVALMRSYVRHKHNPEFSIRRIAPVDPDWLDRKKKDAGIAKEVARFDANTAKGVEKRAALIEMIENGATVTRARNHLRIQPGTYGQWRKRFPEWALKVEVAKHKRKLLAGLDTTPEARAATHPDFTEFRRHYFGYETYEHHRRIIEAIETTPAGGFTMILVPPEAGKTTLLEDWITYRTCLDPNYRLLLCTEAGTGESSQAKKMLGAIKERLTDSDSENPDAQYKMHLQQLHAKYGPFRDPQEDKDKPWNANYIKVHRASGRRDYTVQCCGWRSKVYGSRCDDLVFDDVQSSDSLNMTNAILARMRGTFFSRPGQHGRIIYIGTRVGLGDVPEKLIEAGVIDRLVIIPALDAEGNSYCPEMWPEDALAQKRRLVGDAAWWCNYMQDPRQGQNPTFSRDLLHEARDPLVKLGQVPAEWHSAVSIDPALGGFTSLTAAAWSPTHFQLVDFWEQAGLARNEEIFSLVGDFARRYRPSELVVEINSLQRGLARDDRLQKMARDFGFRIVEHETTMTKWETDFGVGAMVGSFIRREMILPDEDDWSRSRLEPLLNQLEQWRPNVPVKLLRQDGVMSLWFNWRRWQQWREAGKVDETMWQMAGTPWQQQGAGVVGAAPWLAEAGASVFGSAN
jgi:hypothetical protein